jgi:hypothetical protein
MLRRKEWGNCCIHCEALQEDDEEWVFGHASPFSPSTIEEAKEMPVVIAISANLPKLAPIC